MSTEAVRSPRLTIVIPTVNRASLVGRAIDSALAQTYPEIEIIVSNNGSMDGTRELLDRYVGAPRLRISQIEKTIPVNPHGNLLLDMARGEFFLGLSDDDWLEPTFAEKVIELYERYPEVSFVWTGCLIHYADVAVPANTGPEVERGTDFLAAFLAGFRNVCWCACATRTADLRRIGPLPLDAICGDMFYWTKLASFGEVGCVPERLSHYVCYRDGGDGIAGGAPMLKWAREMDALARQMVATCEKRGEGASSSAIVRRDASRFVARSTANQFVWRALRGASRIALLQSAQSTIPFLRSGGFAIWMRVLAALAVPKGVLRNRVLAMAKAARADRP